MSVRQLWAPWRLSYILGEEKTAPKHARAADATGCFLCDDPLVEGPAALYVLGCSGSAFAMLNRYPYNNGHVMVVPRRHVSSLTALTAEENAELFGLVRVVEGVLRDAYHPGGINVGVNLGVAAGAGVDDHVHVHLVPRWAGDTNFMPVFSGTRVIPEMLDLTYAKLAPRLRAAGAMDVCPWR